MFLISTTKAYSNIKHNLKLQIINMTHYFNTQTSLEAQKAGSQAKPGMGQKNDSLCPDPSFDFTFE